MSRSRRKTVGSNSGVAGTLEKRLVSSVARYLGSGFASLRSENIPGASNTQLLNRQASALMGDDAYKMPFSNLIAMNGEQRGKNRPPDQCTIAELPSSNCFEKVLLDGLIAIWALIDRNDRVC
ncbi:hypothetical protein [Ruegeria sp. HKCCA5763]|uniref:hypothetical protein n=1 Tax=Ruegeria sp. HKCCA5763 TaxID=2682987 RepID=UPI00148986D4|nr:hypothetical protein [Ruegeria sp. HKCCA5763]